MSEEILSIGYPRRHQHPRVGGTRTEHLGPGCETDLPRTHILGHWATCFANGVEDPGDIPEAPMAIEITSPAAPDGSDRRYTD